MAEEPSSWALKGEFSKGTKGDKVLQDQVVAPVKPGSFRMWGLNDPFTMICFSYINNTFFVRKKNRNHLSIKNKRKITIVS